jgi:endonuclease-3
MTTKTIQSAKFNPIAPERVAAILETLERTYPEARCALHHKDAWQLLVATILSAQCTDVRVNLVTPALFKKYPTAARLARIEPEELEPVIRSTGFFRNKAKNIVGAARRVMEEFGGTVPQTMEELLRLPGVARKTANVVLGSWFGREMESWWIRMCSASRKGWSWRGRRLRRKSSRS